MALKEIKVLVSLPVSTTALRTNIQNAINQINDVTFEIKQIKYDKALRNLQAQLRDKPLVLTPVINPEAIRKQITNLQGEINKATQQVELNFKNVKIDESAKKTLKKEAESIDFSPTKIKAEKPNKKDALLAQDNLINSELFNKLAQEKRKIEKSLLGQFQKADVQANQVLSSTFKQIKDIDGVLAKAGKLTKTASHDRNLSEFIVPVRRNVDQLKKAYNELGKARDRAFAKGDKQSLKVFVNELKNVERASINAKDGLEKLRTVQESVASTQKRESTKYLLPNTVNLDKVGNKLTTYFNQFEHGIKRNSTLLGKYQNLLDRINFKTISPQQASAEFAQFRQEVRMSGAEVDSFSNKLYKAFHGRFRALIAGSGIFIVLNTLKDMARNVAEVDTAMTELKKVTDATSAAYTKFLDDSSDRAMHLGAKLSEVIQVSSDFARLGYSLSQVPKLADAAIMYRTVGDDIESADQASKSLISTMQAFKIQSNDAMSVVDKFNEVGNRFAISSGDIGEALKRSAPSLVAAGNSLDEAIGLITAAQTTMQDAPSVGTALKTMSMRLRSTKTDMESLGEETDGMVESVSKLREQIKGLTNVDIMKDNVTYKNTAEILKELAASWEHLNDITKANVLELLFGKRMAATGTAIIQNIDILKAATETSANSLGSAAREHEKYMDSIQGKMNQFKAAFEKTSVDFMNSDFLKLLISGGTELIKVFDFLTNHFNIFALALGGLITKGLKANGVIDDMAKHIVNLLFRSKEAEKSVKDLSTSFSNIKNNRAFDMLNSYDGEDVRTHFVRSARARDRLMDKYGSIPDKDKLVSAYQEGKKFNGIEISNDDITNIEKYSDSVGKLSSTLQRFFNTNKENNKLKIRPLAEALPKKMGDNMYDTNKIADNFRVIKAVELAGLKEGTLAYKMKEKSVNALMRELLTYKNVVQSINNLEAQQTIPRGKSDSIKLGQLSQQQKEMIEFVNDMIKMRQEFNITGDVAEDASGTIAEAFKANKLLDTNKILSDTKEVVDAFNEVNSKANKSKEELESKMSQVKDTLNNVFGNYKGSQPNISGDEAGKEAEKTAKKINKAYLRIPKTFKSIRREQRKLASETEHLNKKSTFSVKGFVKAFKRLPKTIRNSGTAAKIASAGFGMLSKMFDVVKLKALALKAAVFALNTMLTLGLGVLMSWAMEGMEKLWKLVPTLGHIKEKAEDSFQEFEDAKDKVTELQTKLKENEEQIKAIQAKGKISITDAEDLKRLKEQNRELEISLELAKHTAKEKEKESSEKMFGLLKKQMPKMDYNPAIPDDKVRFDNNMEAYFAHYKAIQSEIKRANKDNIEDYKEDLNRVKDQVLSSAAEIWETISNINPNLLSKKARGEFEEIRDRVLEIQYEMGQINLGQYLRLKMPEGEIDKLEDTLQALVDNARKTGTKISKEMLDQAGLSKTLQECGIKVDDFLRYVNEQVEKNKPILGLEVDTGKLDQFNSELSLLQNTEAFRAALDGVWDEFNEKGEVSLNTIRQFGESMAGINMGEHADEWKNAILDFQNVLMDTSTTQDDLNGSINNLISQYLSFVDTSTLATDAGRQRYEQILESLGVEDAHANAVWASEMALWAKKDATDEDRMSAEQHMLAMMDDADTVFGLSKDTDTAGYSMDFFKGCKDYASTGNLSEVVNGHTDSFIAVAKQAGKSASNLYAYAQMAKKIQELNAKRADVQESLDWWFDKKNIKNKSQEEIALMRLKYSNQLMDINTQIAKIDFDMSKIEKKATEELLNLAMNPFGGSGGGGGGRSRSGGGGGINYGAHRPQRSDYGGGSSSREPRSYGGSGSGASSYRPPRETTAPAEKPKKEIDYYGEGKAELDHKLKMHEIYYENYYASLARLGDQYLKGRTDKEKEYKKHLEDLLTTKKEAFNYYKDNYYDRWLDEGKMTIDEYFRKTTALIVRWLNDKGNEEELYKAQEALADRVTKHFENEISKVQGHISMLDWQKSWRPLESAADHWSKLLKTIKQSYLNGTLRLEDYNKLYLNVLEKLIKAQETFNKDQKGSLDKLVDMTSSMLKKNLDVMLTKYKKIVDEKKKSLELTKKENAYQETLKEKTEQLAKLQSKLAIMSLDDTRQGKAQAQAIREEIAALQKEIKQFQQDTADEALSSALDEQVTRYEEAINKQTENVGDWLKKVYTYIQTMNPNRLLTQLRDYNYEFGDGMLATVNDIWKECYPLLEKYGFKVEDIIEMLKKKEEENNSENPHSRYVSIKDLSELASSDKTKRQSDLTNLDYSDEFYRHFGDKAHYDRDDKTWYITEGKNVPAEAGYLVSSILAIAQKDSPTTTDINKLNVLLNELRKMKGFSGAWFDTSSGHLYKSANIPIFHEGLKKGFVGGILGRTPKETETLALLQNNELVLNQKDQMEIAKLFRMTKMQNEIWKQLMPKPTNIRNLNGNITIQVAPPQITINGNNNPELIKQVGAIGEDIANKTLDKLQFALKQRGYAMPSSANIVRR